MASAIQIENLTKQFGSKTALDGVTLTAESGQIYGFLGPNGAGKTTTIRCIMDFLRPDQGQVRIFGHDAQRQSKLVKSLIGYMAADNHLYGNWSAKQQLAFARHIWGDLPKADELLRRVQLDPHVAAKHLSTGNHQKLGLVLALAHNPKLVIMDEPTRGLDPLLQHEIQNILTEFRDQGGTVFISSHNLAEVEQLCDQVGIIKDGQMVANKSMADIRAMKAHLVTVTLKSKEALKIDNVEVVHHSDNQYILKSQGDINPLLRQLAKHTIVDVEITHLPLEEVFMSYYRKES